MVIRVGKENFVTLPSGSECSEETAISVPEFVADAALVSAVKIASGVEPMSNSSL